jgi:hypothetical protein
VSDLRREGLSWTVIGELFGVARSTALGRWNQRIESLDS